MSRRAVSANFYNLTQGIVFNAVPFQTYSGYGAVVTAACDLANCKSRHVHYVAISPAKKFFCENFCKSLIRDRLDLLCQNNGFDLEFIKMCITYGLSFEAGKIKDDIELLLITYTNCQGSCLAKGLIEKSATSKISEIISDKIAHLYYFQDIGLGDNSGYIADFHDIRHLHIDIAKQIVDGVFENTEIINYKGSGLSSFDGSIIPIGIMPSPLREHFMQRFSHSFVRIGLPDIDKNAAERLVESF